MVKLACKDYGFECDFEIEGDASKVIEEFGEHTLEEHWIDYGKESLMQFILRKGWLKNFLISLGFWNYFLGRKVRRFIGRYYLVNLAGFT